MPNNNLIKLKEKIIPILHRHGIKKAELFGSHARGQGTKDSDLDILVEIRSDISLLDFVGIKLEIEEAIGLKVDLVEYTTIKPLLRPFILKEAVALV